MLMSIILPLHLFTVGEWSHLVRLWMVALIFFFFFFFWGAAARIFGGLFIPFMPWLTLLTLRFMR